ncbi:thiamine diphosphokinase [Loktanella agnita]
MAHELMVSGDRVVCLVGGSMIENADISAVSEFVDCFIGVDGGADHLLAAGITPRMVIGDLDSLSCHSRATFAHLLCHVSEQETTDFEKALTRVAAPMIIALGFTGGRLDHTLAVLNVMARHPERSIVLVDEYDASFLAQVGETRIALPAKSRLSLMPLSDVRVTATGLRWPLHDAQMHPTGMISSSNEMAAELAVIRTDRPLLVTLPREHLPSALQAAARVE